MALTNNNAKSPSLPDVDVKTFPSAEALADEVIQGLKVAGACIIRHLYNQETMEKFDQEVNPYISGDGNTTCKTFGNLLFPLPFHG